MKVRKGFVSNSSSSSFLIYGVDLSEEEIVQKLKQQFPNESEEIDKMVEVYSYKLGDFVVDKLEKKDSRFESFGRYEYRDENTYLGISFDAIKDDETGLQFKQNIEKNLKEIFGEDIKTGIHSDAWYNG